MYYYCDVCDETNKIKIENKNNQILTHRELEKRYTIKTYHRNS